MSLRKKRKLPKNFTMTKRKEILEIRNSQFTQQVESEEEELEFEDEDDEEDCSRRR